MCKVNASRLVRKASWERENLLLLPPACEISLPSVSGDSAKVKFAVTGSFRGLPIKMICVLKLAKTDVREGRGTNVQL